MKKDTMFCIAVFFLSLGIMKYSNEHLKEYSVFPAFNYNYVRGQVVDISNEKFETDSKGWQKAKVEVLEGEQRGQVIDYTNIVYERNLVKFRKGERYIFTLKDSRLTLNYHRREHKNLMVILGFIVTVIILGGRRGAMSLLALFFTGVVIVYLLIPLLVNGRGAVSTALILTTVIIIVTFPLIGGFNKKSLTAILGTIGGILCAGTTSLLCSWYLKLSGEYMNSGDILIILKRTFHEMDITNLGFAAILIASLGAVMDVSMSISSSLFEMKEIKSDISSKELFVSGVRIGRDVVGTMINTLILAFAGGSLVVIIGLFAYNIQFHHYANSPEISLELVQAVAGSTGIILTVPFTSFFAAIIYSDK